MGLAKLGRRSSQGPGHVNFKQFHRHLPPSLGVSSEQGTQPDLFQATIQESSSDRIATRRLEVWTGTKAKHMGPAGHSRMGVSSQMGPCGLERAEMRWSISWSQISLT